MKSNLIAGLLIVGSLLKVDFAEARHHHYRGQGPANAWGGSSWNAGSFFGWNVASSTGSVRPGEQCHAGDRDPLKCKVCAIYGEDHNSAEGMHAVAGVIETRVQTGHWGSDPCSVVHSRGQFGGAWRRLPNNPALIAAMVEQAQSAGANGYLGFRSYGGHRCVRIGVRGNCYRRSTELQPKHIELDPTMTAEDVDAQAAENAQMTEIQSDADAG